MRSEELVFAKTELQIIDKFLHAPALIKLRSWVIALDSSLVSTSSHAWSNVLHCLGGEFWVETAVWEIIVVSQNVLKWGHGIQNGVLLKLKSLLLLLVKADLTLVQSLHLIYEDLVPLQSDMLVLFHAGCNAPCQSCALGRLVPDVGLVPLNVP